MSRDPVVDDLDTGGFFRAAAEGSMASQCNKCETVLHMPRAYCYHCGSFEGHWRSVEPTGIIYSHTEIDHQVDPNFPVPYTVILVQLDEIPAVRFVGHLDGRPAVRIGQPVKATFTSLHETASVPVWSLASGD